MRPICIVAFCAPRSGINGCSRCGARRLLPSGPPVHRISRCPLQVGHLMATELARDLSGVDAVETTPRPSRAPLRRIWAGLWPKLAAAAMLLAVWQGGGGVGWEADLVPSGAGRG